MLDITNRWCNQLQDGPEESDGWKRTGVERVIDLVQIKWKVWTKSIYFKASWFILDRTLSISNVVELKGMTRNGWHSDKEVMLGIKCEMDFETGWFGTERSAWWRRIVRLEEVRSINDPSTALNPVLVTLDLHRVCLTHTLLKQRCNCLYNSYVTHTHTHTLSYQQTRQKTHKLDKVDDNRDTKTDKQQDTCRQWKESDTWQIQHVCSEIQSVLGKRQWSCFAPLEIITKHIM